MCAPQQSRPHEVDHAVILGQVVLEGRAGQHDPPPAADVAQRPRQPALRVAEDVAFVADQQRGAGRDEAAPKDPAVLRVLGAPGRGEVAVLVVTADHDAAGVVPFFERGGPFGVARARLLQAVDEGCAVAEPFLEFGVPVEDDVDGTYSVCDGLRIISLRM